MERRKVLANNNNCSVEGEECSKPGGRITQGWCSRHYQIFIKRGDPLAERPRLEWIKSIVRESKSECQLWPFRVDLDGYGHLEWRGKKTASHRIAYILAFGEVPAGMLVLHVPLVCRSRSCCNPNHLKLGTHDDNARHKLLRETTARGEKHGMRKLSESEVLAILADDRTQRTIAGCYGIAKTTVGNIKRRKTWRHIKES